MAEKTMKHRTTMWLREDQRDDLATEAEARGVSRTKLVERILDNWMQRNRGARPTENIFD